MNDLTPCTIAATIQAGVAVFASQQQQHKQAAEAEAAALAAQIRETLAPAIAAAEGHLVGLRQLVATHKASISSLAFLASPLRRDATLGRLFALREDVTTFVDNILPGVQDTIDEARLLLDAKHSNGREARNKARDLATRLGYVADYRYNLGRNLEEIHLLMQRVVGASPAPAAVAEPAPVVPAVKSTTKKGA